MDQSVLDAIERWPNVPAVCGWLSLSARGQWRLHPGGTAGQGSRGEDITNQQILSFIDRNYASDDQGRWYFQNGPQRVYVHLDSAPLIVSVTGQPVRLYTHNHLEVRQIDRWLIDRQGNLYLHCEHGPAKINDQDLELVVNALQTEQGTPLMDWWESVGDDARQTMVRPCNNRVLAIDKPAPLQTVGPGDSIEKQLRYITTPWTDS